MDIKSDNSYQSPKEENSYDEINNIGDININKINLNNNNDVVNNDKKTADIIDQLEDTL